MTIGVSKTPKIANSHGIPEIFTFSEHFKVITTELDIFFAQLLPHLNKLNFIHCKNFKTNS